MKRQVLISIAIIVFSLFTHSLLAKVDSTDWQNHFNEQFERLQAWNEKCIQEKRYDETKYFIGYTPFEDFDLTSSACETNEWWEYWDVTLEGSNQDFIQGDYCQELSCRLRSFNLANGEDSPGSSVCGNYQNPNNVQVYAFFLNYWGAISANVEGLENGKLLEYLKSNQPVDYKNYLEARTQVLSSFEFPNVGGNNILIYTSRFVLYNGQANDKKAVYQNRIKSSGSFINDSKDCAYEYGLTNASSLVYPNGTSDALSARQFFRRVVTTLDYYASSSNDCSGCDKSILISLEQFSSDKAKEFVIDNCAAIEEDPTKLKLVLEIAKHIQKREDFFQTAALGVDPLPDTYWVGQWESLDSILAFMNDLNLSVEERLSGLIEQLRRAIANQDGATVYNLLAALQGRDSGYYINLPIDVRIGAIATMANFLSGDALLSFGFGDREQEVINLLTYVPTGSEAKCAILDALRKEHQQSGLLSTLMNNLNNWFGVDNRYEFVKAIKVLAQQGQCNDAIPSEPITVWWQAKESGISFEAPVIENYTYNLAWTPTGLIDFNIQVCTKQDFTEVEGEGTFYYCTEWQDVWEPVDPFALIDVVLLDKVKVIDDCIGDGCKGKVMKAVPAILAYYLFTQEVIEDQKDDALLALDLVLAATGVGDIYLALKLGNIARLALAGYYFSSDILSITVNNEDFQDWVLNQPNGAKTLEFIQSAELINSLLAGSVAMLDLTATAKFVAASEKISTFPNAPPGLIDENTEKIIDAARRELDRGYQGPEELNLRRLQLSGWSVEDLMAHFGITDPGVGSNLFDLYLNGKLPVNDFLGDKFTEAIKNLGSEELINNIFQDIVAKPDIFEVLLGENGVGAWEVLKDFPVLRTQVDNLATLERASSRFRYGGLDGFEALSGVFTTSSSKQKIIDNLYFALDNFPDHPSVKFSAIQAGEVKVISDAGTEVARIIDEVPVLKKFEPSGTEIGDPIDGFQLVDNGSGIGFRVSDPANRVHGSSFEEFTTSVRDNFESTDAYTHQAFYHFQKQEWQQLEDLINANSLNSSYPPNNGGFNVIDDVPITAGSKFDRYGNALPFWTGTGNPPFGGVFTSPVIGGTPYTYSQRALKGSEDTYDFYYEIKVLQDLPFTSQNANVIPWFGHSGGGTQAMWKIPVDPSTGYPKTFNQLAAEGYIRIVIKDSPSGNHTGLIGTVINN